DQFHLRLAFKRGVRVFDADNRRDALERVAAGEVVILFLQHSGFTGIAIDHARDCRAQTRQMRAAVGRVDGIGKRKFGYVGGVGVLESDLNIDNVRRLSFWRNLDVAFSVDYRMECLTILGEVANEGAQAAFKIEGGFLRKRVRSFITECDGHTPGDKRHFPEALFQPFIVEIMMFQHGEVWLEGDDSPRAFSRLKRTNRFNWCQRHASTIRLLPQLAIALYLCYQFFRKGVYC